MNTTYYYVRPTDSLFVRGHLAFGDAGEHGSSAMPPPPSLFAGAFRSAMLGQDARQLTELLTRGACSDAALAQCLGTPAGPGMFRITWLTLAAEPVAGGVPEPIAALPADLLMLGQSFVGLEPRATSPGVQSAGELPLRATLVSAKQEKPKGGIYLRSQGLALHLQGQALQAAHGLESRYLYQRDPRLGIGLNPDAHSAEEGHIYTTEGFAFSPGDDSKHQGAATSATSASSAKSATSATFASTGFLVGLRGAGDLLPAQGVLRLGGDGRSAHYRRVSFTTPTPTSIPGKAKRFRLLLQTPALFSQGWLPEGVTQQDDQSYRLQGNGFSARLACAALGRRETVSGWDLYQWQPKPAQAAVPAGSVYWFDDFAGDAGKLATWVDQGLWPHNPDALQQLRRAEGYNRALLGTWNVDI